MSPRSSRLRQALSSLLVLAAAALIAVAGVLLYATRNLFDSDRFALRASDALAEPQVRDVVADRLTDRIVAAEPDLIGGRPLIEAVAGGIVGSEPFRALYRAAVADLHRTVFEGDRDTVVLKLADAGVLIVEALDSVAPRLAKEIPSGVETRLVEISGGGPGLLAGAARLAEDARWLWIVCLVLAAIAIAAALAISPDRRRTVPWLALAIALVGLAGVAAFEILRALLGAGASSPEGAAALEGVWDAFLLDLRGWSIALAALGLVVAAAGFELIRPLGARARLALAWARLSATPRTPAPRALRALVLLGLGVAVVLFPAAAARVVAVALGAGLCYAGAAELLRLLAPPAERRPERGRAPAWRRYGVIGVLLGVAAALAIVVPAASDGPDAAPLEIQACNGSAELCDRSVDEVVFPGTHNSFSAADQPNWLFAQHERGMPAQLEAGVRALLIDTHYGVETDRGVYTVLEPGSTSREKIEEPLGKRFVETSKQLRRRIGYEGGGEREVFLCHGFCEVGAKRAVAGLESIRDFLVENPHEVLIVSVESDVGLEANEDVFRESGLLDMVWRGPLGGEELPTLREMIETDQRVIVLVWQRGPLEQATFSDYPWMKRQFGLVQETPYDFSTARELLSPESCKPNAGRADNPLFLLNHWVETSPLFLPSNARQVNAYRPFLERARTCERVRGLLPNILAVDFFEEGDLFGVARALNGL